MLRIYQYMQHNITFKCVIAPAGFISPKERKFQKWRKIKRKIARKIRSGGRYTAKMIEILLPAVTTVNIITAAINLIDQSGHMTNMAILHINN
jgi:hypothetical protein